MAYRDDPLGQQSDALHTESIRFLSDRQMPATRATLTSQPASWSSAAIDKRGQSDDVRRQAHVVVSDVGWAVVGEQTRALVRLGVRQPDACKASSSVAVTSAALIVVQIFQATM
jgi:hypothetical protein